MGFCNLCGFVSDDREKYAGHISGHVRRGELSKRLCKKPSLNLTCHCGRVFKNQCGLTIHKKRIHDVLQRKPFELIRSAELLKSRLSEERGHKCEVCGIVEWCGRAAPLQLDHKDGNPTNNDRENLQLICPNCHAQTDTFCGKNIGRPKCDIREKANYPHYRSEDYVKRQLDSLSFDNESSPTGPTVDAVTQQEMKPCETL